MNYIFVAYKAMSTSGGCGCGCTRPIYHDSEFICEDDISRDAVIELLTACLCTNIQSKADHNGYGHEDPWQIIVFAQGKKVSHLQHNWDVLSDEDEALSQDYQSMFNEAEAKAKQLLGEARRIKFEKEEFEKKKAKEKSDAMERAVLAALKVKFENGK